ncbi:MULTISPECIES: ABC transporter ATP-binding protein [Butyrivibrio]|uniref:ABC-2 type transport system ATP-binding protein n=1 Tax=Butyrivibrio hungatei TaxID=185008 RepID=A0A1G5BH58_9FIRM|nr:MULTISPECIES: ABC transporter ATP-binding protein [Butyrivibrio]SCX89523.1 ABC-2 type transport system ATP-binding protein [Butyrivibrio hungatei]
MSNLLEIQGLHKKYGKKTALNDINLSIEPGHIIGLLGPNGSGKTTLIKIICGLLQPTGGSVLVDGNPVGPKSKAIVSYLPDRTYLDESMTVGSAIDMFKYFYDDFDEKRAEEMLSSLNIDPKNKIKTLSKGNKEKVQLILVMSRKAKLYILDEPIAGVDPAARDYILRTIISNFEPSASLIIATHLISDVEPVLDEAIFLQDGNIRLYKPIDDIRVENGKSVDALFREVYRC